MKPIYFPYTYVPRWVAEALATCFKQFIVYQASGRKIPDEMQLWLEAKMMEVRVPVQKDDPALDAVLNDFRTFASLHQGNKDLKTAAFLGQQYPIPFFDESSASRIVLELKKSVRPEPADENADPLFCARVFLDFAQEFDRQSDELNRDLGVFDQRSYELLKNLKGDNEIRSSNTPFATEIKINEPGEYMALGRLRAWVQLFQKDPVGSGIFVTSSKSIFNQLIETLPAAEKIIRSEGLPADEIKDSEFSTWRDQFLKHLKQLVETNWSASKDVCLDVPLKSGGEMNVTLTLYLVPGQRPRDFFAQYVEARNAEKIKPDQMERLNNTLIGLIEYQQNTA